MPSDCTKTVGVWGEAPYAVALAGGFVALVHVRCLNMQSFTNNFEVITQAY